MAGTKYTRKPAKKVAKKNQSITKRGVKKTSTLKRALKSTAKKLGKGAMAIGSMSPVGRGVKAAKVAKKAVKVLKKKRTPAQVRKDKALMKADDKARKQKQYELRENAKYDRGGNRMADYNPTKARKALKKIGLPKKKKATKANPKYSKGDYAYKKKLQARSSAANTQKAKNKIEKEIDLLNPNMTMDERAKLLGGY